jgi:hypothetical protein
MVQTDISQLSAECAEWRQILRNYKEEFNEDKKLLQELCRKNLPKNDYQQVEHFDNQFHIQLINIHDLKQSIKNHEKIIQLKSANLSEEHYLQHESILSEFLNLESMLQELRNEFKQFVSRTSC